MLKTDKLISDSIVDIVKNENGRPIPTRIILKLLNKQKKIPNLTQGLIDDYCENLVNEKVLFKLKSGSLVMRRDKGQNSRLPLNYDTTKTFTGVVNINSKGNGFISVGENDAEYYVDKNNLGGALNGDTVSFIVAPNAGDTKRLINAKIINVVSHSKNCFVALYKVEGEGYKLIFDDSKFYLSATINDTKGLVDGQKILMKLDKVVEGNATFSLIKIIGHSSDVGVDILSIVYDNGVEPNFPDEVLEYARNIRLNIDDYQRKIRHDLTKLPIVTIDPATSKDFDDAIFCKKLDDGNFLLSVSIADVSHYVQFNSILDKEAFKRGCSVYLVDRVIPMLPHNLSDDLCSLNPNVERLTLTCDTIINKNGLIKDIQVYPSIIKSHRRFSYDEVNAFFANQSKLESDTKEVKDMLLASLELHQILDEAKKKRGYINFNVPKPVIVVDDKCVPVEIKKYQSGTAQRMIEDFMVIANEAVTTHAERKQWKFIYRVHDSPNAEAIRKFSVEAKKLSFSMHYEPGEPITSKDISTWVANNKDNKNMDIISLLLLRSMAKAEYSCHNVGHFGLALKNYTHFTSPIRRYPDLIVHRLYWMHEFDKAKPELLQQVDNLLSEYALASSKNELKAVECERGVDKLKFAEYMEKYIGQEFDGFVTSINGFGLFVQLSNCVEGLMPISSLPKDFYHFDQKNNEMVGKNSKNSFCVGKKVRVRVLSANKQERKINFEFVKFL